jgi:hypothetical protein
LQPLIHMGTVMTVGLSVFVIMLAPGGCDKTALFECCRSVTCKTCHFMDLCIAELRFLRRGEVERPLTTRERQFGGL